MIELKKKLGLYPEENKKEENRKEEERKSRIELFQKLRNKFETQPKEQKKVKRLEREDRSWILGMDKKKETDEKNVIGLVSSKERPRKKVEFGIHQHPTKFGIWGGGEATILGGEETTTFREGYRFSRGKIHL